MRGAKRRPNDENTNVLNIRNLFGATREIAIIRDVYEVAALYSVKKDDEGSFERHVTQVKSLYVDYASVLPSSSRQNLLLGLNLVRLMAHNRIAEFHTELELIGPQSRSDAYVDYALSLEHCLMAGSFPKIKDAREKAPHPAFAAFVDRLMITVREEIAACCERAYDKLKVDVAAAMLSLDVSELQDFCDERDWNLVDNYVMFGKDDVTNVHMDDVPSQELIRRSLEYAKELEQII